MTSKKTYQKRIRAALDEVVLGFFEAGKCLIRAKNENNAEFRAMLKDDLSMSAGKARKLMTLAVHPVLSHPQYISVLPPDFDTLALLTDLPDELLLERLKNGGISPALQRKEAAAMVREARQASRR